MSIFFLYILHTHRLHSNCYLGLILYASQGERIMKEITDLQSKVNNQGCSPSQSMFFFFFCTFSQWFFFSPSNQQHMQGVQLMEENERLRQQVWVDITSWHMHFFHLHFYCIGNVCVKVVEISNRRRQVAGDSENMFHEEGQSSESVTNVSNSNGPPQDYESSDTSLKLG